LLHQPKRGFEIPLRLWVDNQLKEQVFDYLSCTNSFYKNFVHADFVNNLLRKKIKIPAEKRAKILWTLLSLEIWYKKVYR
jgi:asparagine synthase (glutamine-hydrolysing)